MMFPIPSMDVYPSTQRKVCYKVDISLVSLSFSVTLKVRMPFLSLINCKDV